MKKLLIVFLCSVLVFVGAFYVCNKADESISYVVGYSHQRPVIVIDAGHGGVDAGTIGIDLYDFLSVCGYDCKLTRAGDYEVFADNEERTKSDLYNRMDYINSFSPCTLISVHQNHFKNESEHGTQIWYSPNDDESKVVADSVLSSVKKNLQPDNTRDNKQSDDSYYLLYKAENPSLMIECGFMSNAEENEKLQNAEYQKEMAYSILFGISEEV